MQLIDEEKFFAKKGEILDFLYDNRSIYGELGELLGLLIYSDVVLQMDNSNIPVQLSQIFSKFDVKTEGMDDYFEFYNLLNKYRFLEGNCCEVGAGLYPRLCELTIPTIIQNKGTLTIYEPNIMFDKIENAILKKEEFNKKTNIDNVDTIYALYPCEATVTVAEKAFQEDKNLMMALCPCDHSTEKHQKWFSDYWAVDFCMDYKEKYGDEVEIIKWPTKTEIDLPIMVRTTAKHKEKLLSLNKKTTLL